MDEFTKIVPSVFGPFIGHHQGSFACVKSVFKDFWKRHELYGHLPPITKTIQVRRTRHAEHCWRSKDELISDVLVWTPAYGQAKAGRSARTYIQQLCEDTGCSPEPCQRRWMIGRSGERGPGISMLAARHDDDDDNDSITNAELDKTEFLMNILKK